MKFSDLVSIRGHHVHLGLLRRDSVAIDLGGHKGEFSRELNARTGCTCHVVEALPELYDRIEVYPPIHKHHYAIAGHDGMVRLRRSSNPEGNSIRAAHLGDTVEVPAITFPTLLRRLHLERVDLIKLDIEGAEISFFDSVSDELLRAIPQLTVEFHDFLPELGIEREVDRVFARMTNLGFRAIVFTRVKRLDTLFLHRSICSKLEHLFARYLVRNVRGFQRVIANRGFHRI